MQIYIAILVYFVFFAFRAPVYAGAYEAKLSTDIPLTTGAAALYAFGFYEYTQMSASGSLAKENLLPWDRPFAGTWNGTASTLSNVVSGFVIVPLAMPAVSLYRGDIGKSDFGTFYLMALQVAGIESGLNLLVRSHEYWARPYMYGKEGGSSRNGAQAYGSFYSGHASAAFATAVFTGIWFSETYPGSQWIPWVWAGSLSAATAVAVLRVAAGKHFPTDVIAGAAAGATVSFTVLKLHESEKNSVSLAGSPQGLFFIYNF